MNDFTKEELCVIHLAIIRDMEQFAHILKSSPSMLKLRDKLETTIDNYCEHEWENICCQCTMDKIYCHKCEKDMGDLKERYDE